MTWQQLEVAAQRAREAGQSWAGFWEQHAADIRACEPWNTRRFHRLRKRLMSIVWGLDGNSTG
jgi:hypothetical protein